MEPLGTFSLDSWPRMPAGMENPFQNAPGPFIYALPNLAGPGPSLSLSSPSNSLDCPWLAPPSDDDDDHHHHHPYHSSAANPTAEPEDLITEDLDDEICFVSQSPLIILDEDNDEDISGSDDTSSSRQQPQQQKQEQSSSGSSTPTPTQGSSSPTESEFSEEKGKRKRRSGKGARRRRRNRQSLQKSGFVMGPRVMGMPGIHLQQWFHHALPQPSLPSAILGVVGHPHAWYPPTGYYGYAVSNSSPAWLLPATTPVHGLFGSSAF